MLDKTMHTKEIKINTLFLEEMYFYIHVPEQIYIDLLCAFHFHNRPLELTNRSKAKD
jgi:hypothetical protein